ncbi:hypothetical protein BLGI_1757 [Brevibacillus laterosporus GI-9]|nr:hypothetical protein BLGI_1757 [Brevibacillus laterosporus GI-9]
MTQLPVRVSLLFLQKVPNISAQKKDVVYPQTTQIKVI